MGGTLLLETAFTKLCGRLSDFHPFSLLFRAELKPMLRLRKLKKGTVLVHRGERQAMVWFLFRGHAKEVSPSAQEMKGRTSWFWYPGDFLFAYPGFFAQEPSLTNMQLIQDSLLLEISYVDFLNLKESFAEVTPLVEKIRGYYERLRVEHADDMLNLSARERYLKFFSAHRELFNVAKQKDIAAFLGIKDDGFHRYQ